VDTGEIVGLIKTRGYEYREEPFRLASGELSHDYIDGKYSVSHGADLRRVAEHMISKVGHRGINAVGGLTMGADPFAHAIALITGWQWFSVRKEPKGRGLGKWIEGARLEPGARVLLVDDVVTKGGSILQAYDHVVAAGAEVVAVVVFMDRGDLAGQAFAERSIPYEALVTYEDLGIERVGPAAAATSR